MYLDTNTEKLWPNTSCPLALWSCHTPLPSNYHDFFQFGNNPPSLDQNGKAPPSLTHLQTAPFMSKAVSYKQTLRKGEVFMVAHRPWWHSDRGQAGSPLPPKSTALHKLLPARLEDVHLQGIILLKCPWLY